jgi:hypothetical protein
MAAWDYRLTRIRRKFVFKGVNFYVYHPPVAAGGKVCWAGLRIHGWTRKRFYAGAFWRTRRKSSR